MSATGASVTCLTTDHAAVRTVVSRLQPSLTPQSSQPGTIVVHDGGGVCPLEALIELAEQLTRDVPCVALVVVNYFDDALVYWLYRDGELRDEYISNPEAFEDLDADEASAEQGGSASVLAELCEQVSNIVEVEQVLRSDEFTFASERHERLVMVLGLDPLALELSGDRAPADAALSVDQQRAAYGAERTDPNARYVGVSLYWGGDFGTATQDWLDLGTLLASAFGWQALDRLEGLRRLGNKVPRRAATSAQAERIAEVVRAGEMFVVTLSRKGAQAVPGEERCGRGAAYFKLTDVWWKGQPEFRLPWSLFASSRTESSWPDAGHLSALLQLMARVGAEHATVFVGVSPWAAQSEAQGTPIRYFERPEPVWAAAIDRQRRYRHALGPLVRGAYWGTLLSAEAVTVVGGLDALHASGAWRVHPLANGAVYVQLTETVATALDPDAIACRDALRELLLPITPSERYPENAPRMDWEIAPDA